MAFRLLLGLTLMAAAHTAKSADPPKTGFVDKTFKNADGTESPYVVFVPHAYDGSKPVPVILFLHGAGESKGGQLKPVEQGIGNHLRGRREKSFPAIVVIPQAEHLRTPVLKRWQAGSPDSDRALAMLDAVQKEYKTDPNRVYLTGLSMGGFGTWSLAAAHPEKWAAVVPICGGGDPAKADALKDLPCWAWHGDKDGAVKVEQSRQMVDAIKKAGGNPRYTELAWIGHNSWDAAYASDDLYAWLFAQKKK
jgi:predicted peptidase